MCIIEVDRQDGEATLLFEWDEEKNAANVKKHGIDFEDAIRVFEDDDRIEIYDAAKKIGIIRSVW